MSKTAEQYLDTTVAPHLSESEYKDDFLTDATAEIGAEYYKQYTNKAIALLAAHNMTVMGLNTGAAGHTPGSVGAIAGVKEGELQIQYYIGAAAQKNGMVGDLDQTSYGLQLKHLQKVANLSISATGEVDNLGGLPKSGYSGGIVF